MAGASQPAGAADKPTLKKRSRSRSRSTSPPRERKRPAHSARPEQLPVSSSSRNSPASKAPQSRTQERVPTSNQSSDRLENRRGAPEAEKRKRSASPPRQRKRPGAAARITNDERQAHQQRLIEREREREKEQAAPSSFSAEAVAHHYNAVPQRGREWRNTESAIRYLRSYNNWVKSTLIQKFSPSEEGNRGQGIKVLDVGCGKGGDLQKWHNAPQPVELYVGVDPAAVSITQAEGRYHEMRRKNRRHGMFHAEFKVKDCYGEWLGEIPIIREVGIAEEVPSRWQEGGFDVVSMMFCLHYAFESEAKCRGMLRNVAGALKKGGRLIGVIPNSDVLREHLAAFQGKAAAKKGNGPDPSSSDTGQTDAKATAREKETGPEGNGEGSKNEEPANPPKSGTEEHDQPDAVIPEWGNSIYRVRFPANTPLDGKFKPPFGWKYSYFLEEAVEELPEFVVPWEAFRGLAEDVNLELQYRKPFLEVWGEDKNDRDLGPLSVRMKVTDAVGGNLRLTADELDAVGLYHAFCFYKV